MSHRSVRPWLAGFIFFAIGGTGCLSGQADLVLASGVKLTAEENKTGDSVGEGEETVSPPPDSGTSSPPPDTGSELDAGTPEPIETMACTEFWTLMEEARCEVSARCQDSYATKEACLAAHRNPYILFTGWRTGYGGFECARRPKVETRLAKACAKAVVDRLQCGSSFDPMFDPLLFPTFPECARAINQPISSLPVKALDETCSDSEQCGEGLRCSYETSCPGKCVAAKVYPKLGESCTVGARYKYNCEDGLQCPAGTCVNPGALGSFGGKLGDTCAAGGPYCLNGLKCDAASSKCVLSNPMLGDSCVFSSECGANLRCDGKVCKALGVAGDACDLVGCAAGFTCVVDKCEALRKEGGQCSVHGDCEEPLYCSNHKCPAPKVCTVP